jgi:hypothetical protein
MKHQIGPVQPWARYRYRKGIDIWDGESCATGAVLAIVACPV